MTSTVIQQPEKKEEAHDFNRIAIVAVLLVSAFVAILNQTLLNTALPNIMTNLKVSATTAQWLMTGFMLVNGVMIPITAFLIAKFTTRRLFFIAMGLFTAGTLIAAIAPNFSVLLIARVIQAAGAGIMLPLMQTVMLLIFPPEKRGAAMGTAGLVIAFAPAFGPTLSGWLVETYNWRVPFIVILPIAAASIIFGIFALKNVTPNSNPKIDTLSVILSTLGFGGLLYGLSNAGSDGWGDWRVYIPAIIGAVSLFIFIRRQFKIKNPILEFRVFTYGFFPLTVATVMITMMAMIGAALLIPLYMQTARGYSPLQSGLLLLPGALVMGVMSPITGRLFDRFGARWLAFTGLVIVAVTTFGFTRLTETTPYKFIIIDYSVRMFGIAMIMMPVSTSGLNQLPKRLLPHGTAMNNTMRTIAGSMGTALLVSIMTKAAKGYKPDMASLKGLAPAQMKQHIATHAMIHGMNVAFMVATIIAMIGIILSLFIKKTNPNLDD